VEASSELLRFPETYRKMSEAANPYGDGKACHRILQALEFMAAGLPVVASPVGVNNAILAKGQAGFAATSEDEWFEALETIYKDHSLRIKLGNNGRRIVEQYYSISANVNKLADILKTSAGL
jgi:glycosyltransferase involved in cell wall biosynthesis